MGGKLHTAIPKGWYSATEFQTVETFFHFIGKNADVYSFKPIDM